MSERAAKLWAKIKESLEDRSLYHDGLLDEDLIAEIDAEQVAEIDAVLGDTREDGFCQPDSIELKVTRDRTPEGVPFLVASSSSFLPRGDAKVQIPKGSALVIEPRNGSIHVHRRKITW